MLALAALRKSPNDLVAEVAPTVGADVPFFLVGGTAWIEGYGERITEARIDTESWALAIAVPDFELRTADVYRAWDRLGGSHRSGSRRKSPATVAARARPVPERPDPGGDGIETGAGGLDRQKLAETWERPVAMSGSGPALFAFFADIDEAEGAVRSLPRSFRASQRCPPEAERCDQGLRSYQASSWRDVRPFRSPLLTVVARLLAPPMGGGVTGSTAGFGPVRAGSRSCPQQ